ncbi:hypothetical protein ABBQ38_003694 [Trebouxia sp. C0009 RCD-2024]
MARLVLERDALIAFLMWETSVRGINCGKVTLLDFLLPEGQNLSLPLADPLPQGSLVLFKPNGTKTVKGQRSGPFPLTVRVDATHSFLGRLPVFLKCRMQPDAAQTLYLVQTRVRVLGDGMYPLRFSVMV